jgi:membrane associated rhomboid family serine protease
MFKLTPMVRNLLIVNVAVFFFSQIFPTGIFAFFNPVLPLDEGGFTINPYFRFWQPFTYMFLHGGLGHIFSNMFGLVIFGPALESYMGSKKFLSYYLITGVGAALFYSGLNTYDAAQYYTGSEPYRAIMQIPMVGASGAIFGLLAAFGVLFAEVELMMLFFPIPIKAKYFVILYGLYEIYSGTSGAQTGVAHFAHVGGLIVGFVLIKFFRFDEKA